jgi:hypothetical protein
MDLNPIESWLNGASFDQGGGGVGVGVLVDGATVLEREDFGAEDVLVAVDAS